MSHSQHTNHARAQVNYLGPFLLTELLLAKLKASAPARIVNVASLAHSSGKVELILPSGKKDAYQPYPFYANSKLAQILHAAELQKRLRGCGVAAFSVHPGVVRTNLGSQAKSCSLLMCMYKVACCCPCIAPKGLFLTIPQGASTQVRCCVDPTLAHKGGQYYTQCQPASLSGTGRGELSKAADLYDISREWCGLAGGGGEGGKVAAAVVANPVSAALGQA